MGQNWMGEQTPWKCWIWTEPRGVESKTDGSFDLQLDNETQNW